MYLSPQIISIFVLYCFSGCAQSDSAQSTTAAPSAGPGGQTTTDPALPPSSKCSGKRLGMYTWGTELWRGGERILSDFFATSDGRAWGCGDVTINIGDYTAPGVIAYSDDIIPFIRAYRASSENYESVVWLSYGDVVSGDGSLMEEFIDTFYAWASAIPSDIANSLGTIGLSFDVEHMPAIATESALQKAQALKSSTQFGPGKLLIQHTIEGLPNPDGADFVMRYADSALIMLYRNYMESPIFSRDSNILSRAFYFLKQQCIYCLDDAYALSNYKAKITIMVEGSCSPADYCAKISFCAHDSPTEGANYLWKTLQDLESGMFSSGLVTANQFTRLFNPLTTFSVHDWSCMLSSLHFDIVLNRVPLLRAFDGKLISCAMFGISGGSGKLQEHSWTCLYDSNSVIHNVSSNCRHYIIHIHQGRTYLFTV